MSTGSSLLTSTGGDDSKSINSVVQKQGDDIAKISKQVRAQASVTV